MRKPLIALVATITLALAGVLIAAPKMTNNAHIAATAGAGIDLFSLTRGARNLPEQSYPAH